MVVFTLAGIVIGGTIAKVAMIIYGVVASTTPLVVTAVVYPEIRDEKKKMLIWKKGIQEKKPLPLS